MNQSPHLEQKDELYLHYFLQVKNVHLFFLLNVTKMILFLFTVAAAPPVEILRACIWYRHATYMVLPQQHR